MVDLVVCHTQGKFVKNFGSCTIRLLSNGRHHFQLKKAIKEENPNKLKNVDAADLQLFLAKTTNGAWLPSRTEDVKMLRKGETTDVIKTLTEENKELQAEEPLEHVLKEMGPPLSFQIQVLVVIRGRVEEGGAWSAKALSNVDSRVQAKIWKSVVRVSSGDECSGTALVVGRSPTHLYLLTNLSLWDDPTFTDHLSAQFKHEIKRLHPTPKSAISSSSSVTLQARGGDVAMRPCHKSPRTTATKTPMVSDKPQVVVEQLLLLPGATELTEVHRFNLDGDKCWRSSAVFDYAIFEVAVPQDINLVQLETPVAAVGIKDVHVVGFPGALQEHTLDHPYATIPAEITGWRGNKMILSSTPASGFSGGGVVCTKRGAPVGYVVVDTMAQRRTNCVNRMASRFLECPPTYRHCCRR